MIFKQFIFLYFCTTVSALYPLYGGYKAIWNYVRKKIDDAVEKVTTSGSMAQSVYQPQP
ncbi:DUF1378 family protein [Yersinia enterocolitica]|uniref:DUF1378 family protein n=1 Tax=Yersinia enterocolitica TaxID=630 RepID=UPI00398D2A97